VRHTSPAVLPGCRHRGKYLEAPLVDLSNAGVPIVIVLSERLQSADGRAKADWHCRLVHCTHIAPVCWCTIVLRGRGATGPMSTAVDLVSLVAA
jgi:hypothetical protein